MTTDIPQSGDQPRPEFAQRIDEIKAKLKARNQQAEGRMFMELGEGNSQFFLFDSPIPVEGDQRLSEYLLLTREGFVTVRCMSANSPDANIENPPVFADSVRRKRGMPDYTKARPEFTTLPDGSTDLRVEELMYHFGPPDSDNLGFPSEGQLNRVPSEDSVVKIITLNIERVQREKQEAASQSAKDAARRTEDAAEKIEAGRRNSIKAEEIRSAQLPIIAKVDSLL